MIPPAFQLGCACFAESQAITERLPICDAADLLRNRLDVARASAELHAATARVGVARRTTFPGSL